MKKFEETVEILDFYDDKPKVGRPRLADKKTKKKSLIIACLSLMIVALLMIFGYGTLIGFNNNKLLGSIAGTTAVSNNNEKVLISDINPINKNVTMREGTVRKVYVTVLPASATNKNLIYDSSNDDVATVDKNGRVSAVAEGSTTITIKSEDGSNTGTEINVDVIKDASGYCKFNSLIKENKDVNYSIECDNAKVKEIQYKVDGDYKSLTTKKLTGDVKLSSEDLKKEITFKVIYYPNNSSVTKYSEKTIKVEKITTTKPSGECLLSISKVNANSAKYDVTCDNATVTKIAYKIGNGSYVGIDTSSLADTVLFEESDVTRIIYFNIEYKIDGSDIVKSVSKSSIVEKKDVN